MKRLLLLAPILLGNWFISDAKYLTPDEALSRANANGMQKSLGISNVSLNLETFGNVYIFSNGNSYMILPNNDLAPAVLGFSDNGAFSIDGNPALKSWIEYYDNQLEYLQSNPSQGKQLELGVRKERDEISPLLKTRWNQEYPYNMLCPKVDGHETVTGCVATAMAQLMKYYNYPPKGKGEHSYYWEPGKQELKFDYETNPFEWDLMTDRYDRDSSEEARKAVAELMLGCGISVNMHYEPGGSGAATSAMGTSLIDIFGYSKATWMPNRVFYGYDEWEDMVYADLAQARPVLYSGAGTDGGHQFVCDGYLKGYFHFNWGWGGLSNGYFLLTALNPDHLGVGGGAGGFNSSQIATLGLSPAKGDEKPVYVMYNTERFVPYEHTVKAGDDFRCSGAYFNYSLATLPDESRLGMKFESLDHSIVRYVEGPNVSGYHLDDGRMDIQIRFPELPDGTYIVTPALHVEGKWEDVRMPVGAPAKVVATVTDYTAVFESEEPAYIEAKDIIIPEVIYRDHDFHMEFTVYNPSEMEYYNRVTPYLLDSEHKTVAKSVFRPIDLLPGETQHITDYKGKFVKISNEEFPVGTYTLVLRDNMNKDINTPVEVKVEDNVETGMDKITDNDSERIYPIYDLNGIEQVQPLAPGLYIRGSQKIIVK